MYGAALCCAGLSFQGQSSRLSSCLLQWHRVGNAFQKSNFKSIFRSLFVDLDALDNHYPPSPDEPTNPTPTHEKISVDSRKQHIHSSVNILRTLNLTNFMCTCTLEASKCQGNLEEFPKKYLKTLFLQM